MRKIKSTALLGAFVAVASVGVISHEAHGTTVSATPVNIPKEMLPGSVTLTNPITITPNETIPAGTSVTLKLSDGAEFSSGSQYFIGDQSCTSATLSQSSSSIVLSCTSANGLTAGTPYQISTSGASNNLVIYVPQSSSSIVLAYSSTLTGDISGSAPIAQVQPQLYFAPISAGTAYINPSSLSTFLNGVYASNNNASNSVVLSNSAYNNNTWSNTINGNDTINFVFTGIPGSVSTAADEGVTASDGHNQWNSTSIVNGSATVSFTLANTNAPFQSASSDTITFTFSNSSNASISSGTISLSSIVGQVGSYSSVTYLSTPQTFLTFTLGATQIYIPDALAPDNNEIGAGYITISMPSSASIASISVLNNPNASCPVPTAANGSFTSTSGVSYIDLSKLAPLCTGLDSKAWGSGVPLVITISGSNVGPNTVTADAYAVINGFGLKRIPVNVISGNGPGFFSY